MQQGHPLAFISKALGVKAQALSTYEKECLAILLAVSKWRPYLQHSEFVIQTDHKSLTHLGEQQLNTPMQQKAFIKLMGLQYRIRYKKGVENRVADALSRKDDPMEEVLAISVSSPKWLDIVVAGYGQDTKTKQLLETLPLHPEGIDHFRLVHGVIRYKGRIWLGHHKEAQQAVLLALHDSGVGGHSGITATYQRIKNLFAWPGLQKDVQWYVSQCTTCQQAKVEHCKSPGLLQPLPVPVQAWSTVSMDFIEGLPKSGKYDTILVVVDKFSKFAKFIPLSHPFTAYTVAQAFLQHVYDVFGMPQVIISDRDRIFTSALWQELFKLADVKLNMSSSYHPQTDGQTERLNQCLEGFLRCTVHAALSKWSNWLSQAQHWYNTSFHSALNKSPYEVLFARKPTHFGLVDVGISTVPDVQLWLQERAQMNEILHQQLVRAQQRMKHQADKKRSERQFAVGDKVYLKLQPFVQLSVARRSCQKLSFRYFGPYTVLERIGAVAYRLDLPASSQIHPVVHVSLLKGAVKPNIQVSSDLPLHCSDEDNAMQPEAVLRRSLIKRGKSAVPYGLIKWTGMPTDLATWENLRQLKVRFPDAAAWGQAGS